MTTTAELKEKISPEQYLIEEIRKTYGNTYPNAILTLSNRVMVQDKEIESLKWKLDDAYKEQQAVVEGQGEDALWAAAEEACPNMHGKHGSPLVNAVFRYEDGTEVSVGHHAFARLDRALKEKS